MEKLHISEKHEGTKPERVFEAGKSTFSDLGIDIKKVRTFAFLLQGSLSSEEHLINANFIVSAFQNEFNLTLTSETANKEELNSFANRFIKSLKNYLDNN